MVYPNKFIIPKYNIKENTFESFGRADGLSHIQIDAMAFDNQQIQLIIQDNGKGFVLEKINPGNGLQNIRQRSQEIKGKLYLTSSPGEGAKIEFILRKTY